MLYFTVSVYAKYYIKNMIIWEEAGIGCLSIEEGSVLSMKILFFPLVYTKFQAWRFF